MPFVELDGSLVFLCRCPGGKRPQIAAAAGLRILLAGSLIGIRARSLANSLSYHQVI
jgi:hypothetical protein